MSSDKKILEERLFLEKLMNSYSVSGFEEENKRLKEQIEMYKKRFREIKRILPEEV